LEPKPRHQKFYEYRKILDGLELNKLFLSRSGFSMAREHLSPNSLIMLKEVARFIKRENNIIEIVHEYKLRVVHNESKKQSIKIDCVYNLEYSSKQDFTIAFFNKFKKTSLPVNTWPFFREFVNSSTARMNIPPLVLPLLKRII